MSLFFTISTPTTYIYTLALHDALPICPISISNTHFIAANFTGLPTLSSTDTISITARRSSPHANLSYNVTGHDIKTQGDVTLPNFELHLTANSTLRGSFSLPAMTVDSA